MKGSSHRGGERPVDQDAVRVALLTPVGRGALAVVGVAGPAALERVSRLFVPRGVPLAERADGAIVLGRWTAGVDQPAEDVIVVRRGAGDLEIHCHGGLAASEAVVASLERHGAVRLAWPDWLRSVGVAEIEVEAREALSAAGGPKASQILSRQLSGRLQAELDRVEGLRAEGRAAEATAVLDRLARAARVGLRLVRPWRVVLAGSVNAGKSSLINALAGHGRSIVSPEPGTTLDVLETRLVLDGWEVDLIDTAGVREDDAMGAGVTSVERAGVARAVAARKDADLVLCVVDARQAVAIGGGGAGQQDARRELQVASKADLTDQVGSGRPEGMVWTSAVTGEGIAELATAIVRRLVPEEREAPELLEGAVPFTERQMEWVAETRRRVETALNPGAAAWTR